MSVTITMMTRLSRICGDVLNAIHETTAAAAFTCESYLQVSHVLNQPTNQPTNQPCYLRISPASLARPGTSAVFTARLAVRVPDAGPAQVRGAGA